MVQRVQVRPISNDEGMNRPGAGGGSGVPRVRFSRRAPLACAFVRPGLTVAVGGSVGLCTKSPLGHHRRNRSSTRRPSRPTLPPR
jgi:hypothetical protein